MTRCAYHDMGRDGEPYPTLLRVLGTACGVYIIRNKQSKRVLYVGSSAKTLYGTITRHLQKWGRAKKFWRDQYSKAHDPGVTYRRADVEVCVEVMRRDADFLAREAELIHQSKPRDNLVKNPDGDEERKAHDDLEEAPF